MAEEDDLNLDDNPQEPDKHWTDDYPSLKGNALLKRYVTQEDAHKGFIETKAAFSDPLRLPKTLGKISNEQRALWEANVAKLRGVPENADDYELKEPKDFKLTINEEKKKQVKELAKQLHVPQATLQAFYNFQNNMMAEALATHEQDNEKATKECIEALEETWGKEEAKENLVLIERALRSKLNPNWQDVKADDDEAWQQFKKTVYLTGVGNNQTIMELLAIAARSLESTGNLLPGVHEASEKKVEEMSEKEIQQTHFQKSPEMVNR